MRYGRRLGASLLVACFTGGCAGSAGGGPVGTGISASVSGNIIAVEDDSSGDGARTEPVAGEELAGVQVSIDEVSGAETSSDADGNFALGGTFAGALTLRFSTPDFEVTQRIDVRAGAATVLQDIELRPDGVAAQAVRQLGASGEVAFIDCADETVIVDDRRRQEPAFTVRLTADTVIDRRGQLEDCEAIHVGDEVEVNGLGRLAADGTITALAVHLSPPRPPRKPPPVQQVPLLGDISALDCGQGSLVIDDSLHRTRVRLSATTPIVRPDGTPLDCADLRLGDRVVGQGRLTLDMPGLVDATALTVVGGSDTPVLRLFGFVTLVDCGTGTLLLNDSSTIADVRLQPGTVIVHDDQRPATCTDIRLGDRVEGQGIGSSESPGVIDALMIFFRPAHGPPPPHPPPPPRPTARNVGPGVS